MTEVSTRYRLHGPRRRGPQGSPVLPLAITVVVLVIVLIAVIAGVDDEPDQPPPPAPGPSPAAPSSAPTPGPSHTPTPEPVAGESGWAEAEVVLPPTPSPTWPVFEPAPTRAPRATPTISQCAHYSWTTMQVFTPSAQVKVDIRVDNRCPYDLGPDNLLFEITGWRDGGRVQSVRGVPFETIRRGWTGELSIGLPGSEDWYDEIEVLVFD